MISSKLEKYIIVVEFSNEDTTEFLNHSVICSNSPLTRNNCSSRTVKTEVERYISCSCAIVSNYEVKLFLFFSYLEEIKAVPSLASRNGSTSPIEVNSFGTCVVHDVVCLKHFSRKRDHAGRTEFEIQLEDTQL